MTVGVSTTNTANKWLDAIRTTGSTFTTIGTAYVKLHIGDPGSVGTANPSAGDATRKTVSHNAAAAGAITISGTSGPWTNGGSSETLSHVSVWDASTNGNFLYSASLTAPQAWASGNTFTLNALTVSITPLAA